MINRINIALNAFARRKNDLIILSHHGWGGHVSHAWKLISTLQFVRLISLDKSLLEEP
jgi:hypothetical protein